LCIFFFFYFFSFGPKPRRIVGVKTGWEWVWEEGEKGDGPETYGNEGGRKEYHGDEGQTLHGGAVEPGGPGDLNAELRVGPGSLGRLEVQIAVDLGDEVV
jgi:hypothetical protein